MAKCTRTESSAKQSYMKFNEGECKGKEKSQRRHHIQVSLSDAKIIPRGPTTGYDPDLFIYSIAVMGRKRIHAS